MNGFHTSHVTFISMALNDDIVIYAEYYSV